MHRMLSGRVRSAALVGCVAATIAGAPDAGATIAGANVVTCASAGSADIGDAKISPGLTINEQKNSISATFGTITGCTGNEAVLDEIAAESKFGVTKTAAGGRTAIAGFTAKAKFTMYGDCLGILAPEPPGGDAGEYAPYGTVSITWLDSAGGKPAKSTVFGSLNVSIAATINGIVTKGAGVGGTFTFGAGFVPSPLDDKNGSTISDFVECVSFGDPTAVGIYLDVTNPISLTIDMPL